MKILIPILFLLITVGGFTQTAFLINAVAKLDKALVEKDTIVLKQILHNELSYGHSNAWVESKRDLLKKLYNGKITYSKIENKDFTWVV